MRIIIGCKSYHKVRVFGQAMKNIFLAISLFAVAAGCRSDQASILLDTVDVMGTDPEDVWTRNHEMAILSDYIYQLRNPDKGFIPWSAQEHKDFKATGYQLLYFEQKNGEYAFFIQPKSGRIAVVFREQMSESLLTFLRTPIFRFLHSIACVRKAVK